MQWWRFRFTDNDGNKVYGKAIAESEGMALQKVWSGMLPSQRNNITMPDRVHATRLRAKEKQWGIQ